VSGPCTKSRPAGLPWKATTAGGVGNVGPLRRQRRGSAVLSWPGPTPKAGGEKIYQEGTRPPLPGAPSPEIELPWCAAG
jgi:hypothetical protein